MTHDALPPTQVAYDRIQRAGCRSPLVQDDVVVVYELRKDGIRVRAVSDDGMELGRVVSWTVLALDVNDPLVEAQRWVIDGLREARSCG